MHGEKEVSEQTKSHFSVLQCNSSLSVCLLSINVLPYTVVFDEKESRKDGRMGGISN